MTVVAVWLCWVVPREVVQPLVSKRFWEFSPPLPRSLTALEWMERVSLRLRCWRLSPAGASRSPATWAGGCYQEPLNAPFLNGLFSSGFSRGKTAKGLGAKSGKRPMKGGKWPIKVGISVGCLTGCFPAPPPWRKTAPLKRPIKGPMMLDGRAVQGLVVGQGSLSPQAWTGRLIFIHLHCWEVLPFCIFRRQRCIKIRVLRAQDFYTPLALKTAKGQHLPALEVSKHQSPMDIAGNSARAISFVTFCRSFKGQHD